MGAVTIQWTRLLEWTILDLTTGLTETASGGERNMHGAKAPGHKTCSSVVVAHLNVASSSVPSNKAFFASGWEPGCGYILTPPKSVHLHYELHVEGVCV